MLHSCPILDGKRIGAVSALAASAQNARTERSAKRESEGRRTAPRSALLQGWYGLLF